MGLFKSKYVFGTGLAIPFDPSSIDRTVWKGPSPPDWAKARGVVFMKRPKDPQIPPVPNDGHFKSMDEAILATLTHIESCGGESESSG